jgi:hypothetical protein
MNDEMKEMKEMKRMKVETAVSAVDFFYFLPKGFNVLKD